MPSVLPPVIARRGSLRAPWGVLGIVPWLLAALLSTTPLLLPACGSDAGADAAGGSPAGGATTGPAFEVDPVTAATIEGRINFSGPPPKPLPIHMAAEAGCKAAHEDAVPRQDILVNPDGTLRNVFVYVKHGLEGKRFAAPETPAHLDQEGCLYAPRVFGVQRGQPIEIRNLDPLAHNVHAIPEVNSGFNLTQRKRGDASKARFDREEVMVRFKCDIHPWMGAFCGVLSHPYFAVSGEDGSFAIRDLPPGTYTLEAWHETQGTREAEVSLAPGETKAVDFSY